MTMFKESMSSVVSPSRLYSRNFADVWLLSRPRRNARRVLVAARATAALALTLARSGTTSIFSNGDVLAKAFFADDGAQGHVSGLRLTTKSYPQASICAIKAAVSFF